MDMPFGKYRGIALSAIPEGYLLWLLDNVDLRDELEEAVRSELSRRRTRHREEPNRPAGGMDPKRIEDDIQALRRRYALKHHPDRGGSLEAMQAINSLCDDVLSLVRRES